MPSLTPEMALRGSRCPPSMGGSPHGWSWSADAAYLGVQASSAHPNSQGCPHRDPSAESQILHFSRWVSGVLPTVPGIGDGARDWNPAGEFCSLTY